MDSLWNSAKDLLKHKVNVNKAGDVQVSNCRVAGDEETDLLHDLVPEELRFAGDDEATDGDDDEPKTPKSNKKKKLSVAGGGGGRVGAAPPKKQPTGGGGSGGGGGGGGGAGADRLTSAKKLLLDAQSQRGHLKSGLLLGRLKRSSAEKMHKQDIVFLDGQGWRTELSFEGRQEGEYGRLDPIHNRSNASWCWANPRAMECLLQCSVGWCVTGQFGFDCDSNSIRFLFCSTSVPFRFASDSVSFRIQFRCAPESISVRLGLRSRFGSLQVRLRFGFGTDSLRIWFGLSFGSLQIRFRFASESSSFRFRLCSDSVLFRSRFGFHVPIQF